MSRLTKPQRRALGKLKSAWQTYRILGERRATLDALVDRRLANRAATYSCGWSRPVSAYRVTPAGVEKQNSDLSREGGTNRHGTH